MLIANTDLSKGPRGFDRIPGRPEKHSGRQHRFVENKCGIRTTKVAEIILDNAVIPASRMIGEEGKGFRYALTALNAGRLGVAAQGLGLAEGAFDICRDYMMEREQFGQPIYKNQYLAFRMADMKNEIDMCKLLLYKGVWEQQQGMDFSVSACQAKLLHQSGNESHHRLRPEHGRRRLYA